MMDIFRRLILASIGRQQRFLVRGLEVSEPSVGSALRKQILGDFGFIPAPVLLHSPVPELMAGAWMLLREVLLVGSLPREAKEAVSLYVSHRNRCQFCIDSHVMVLNGLGHASLSKAICESESAHFLEGEAGRALRVVESLYRDEFSPSVEPTFDEDANELMATVLVFEYLNRMVTVFLAPSPFPLASVAPWKQTLQKVGAWVCQDFFERQFEPGLSLSFLPDERGAQGRTDLLERPFQSALMRFEAAAIRARPAQLGAYGNDLEQDLFPRYAASAKNLGNDWLEEAVGSLGVSTEGGNLVRLSLLAALAPEKIDSKRVSAAREEAKSDATVLGAVAWAAFTRARQIVRTGSRSFE